MLSRLVWAPEEPATDRPNLNKRQPKSGVCERRYLLYVEDDKSTFLLLKRAFEVVGESFEVSRACDGDEAIEYLRQSGRFENAPRPWGIILDLRLPKKGGLEVLTDIQGCESMYDIPIIVFTSFPSSEERKKAFALGASGYVAKPCSIDGFVAAAEMIQTLIG